MVLGSMASEFRTTSFTTNFAIYWLSWVNFFSGSVSISSGEKMRKTIPVSPGYVENYGNIDKGLHSQ